MWKGKCWTLDCTERALWMLISIAFVLGEQKHRFYRQGIRYASGTLLHSKQVYFWLSKYMKYKHRFIFNEDYHIQLITFTLHGMKYLKMQELHVYILWVFFWWALLSPPVQQRRGGELTTYWYSCFFSGHA